MKILTLRDNHRLISRLIKASYFECIIPYWSVSTIISYWSNLRFLLHKNLCLINIILRSTIYRHHAPALTRSCLYIIWHRILAASSGLWTSKARIRTACGGCSPARLTTRPCRGLSPQVSKQEATHGGQLSRSATNDIDPMSRQDLLDKQREDESW